MLKLSEFVDVEMPKDVINEKWPNLDEKNARNTSEYDSDYNCFGYVLGDKENWWWPLKKYGIQWPTGYPYINVLPNILKMLKEKFNYEKCDDGSVEQGYEKIVIYGENSVTPKHYAKQLPNGKWSSKLGQSEDIEHDTLDALIGNCYGEPIAFAKRKVVVAE